MGIEIGDIIEVTLQFDLHDEVCYNVFHYRVSDLVDGSKELNEDVTDEVKATLWTGKLQTACDADVGLRGIRVVRVAPTPSNPWIELESEQGTIAGDNCLPGTCAVVVSKYSSLASRSSRGRNYFVGLAEGDTELGRIEAGGQAKWEAVADAMLDDLQPANWDASTWNPVIFSRKKFDAAVSPYHFEVTRTHLRPQVATQRSRRTKSLGFS